MDKQRLERDLRAMGYRPMRSEAEGRPFPWGKPVAMSLYMVLVHEEKLEFVCWFRSFRGDETLVWDRDLVKFADLDRVWSDLTCSKHMSQKECAELECPMEPVIGTAFLNWLKYMESYKSCNKPSCRSRFEFLNWMEALNL